VIVPDGALFELPFEALLTEEPAPGPPGETFLSRAPAVNHLCAFGLHIPRLCKAGRARPEDPKTLTDLVAMGDPDYSLLKRCHGRMAPLQPLPHTRTEVTSIAEMMKDKNLDAYVGARGHRRGQGAPAGTPGECFTSAHP